MLSIPNNSFLNGWYKFLPRNVRHKISLICVSRRRCSRASLSLSRWSLFGRSIDLSRLISPFRQSTSTDGCVSIHWRDNARQRPAKKQRHPPLAQEEPTHCPFVPPSAAAVPSLASCHRLLPIQSREKKRRRKRPMPTKSCERVASRNMEHFIGQVLNREERYAHYSRDNKLWILCKRG